MKLKVISVTVLLLLYSSNVIAVSKVIHKLKTKDNKTINLYDDMTWEYSNEISAKTSKKSNQKTTSSPSEKDYDMVTTYSTYLGRAVACGADIQQPMKKVGAWMDRTFSNKERSSQLLVFTTGIQYSAEQQKNGTSPDTCNAVIRTYNKVNWP